MAEMKGIGMVKKSDILLRGIKNRPLIEDMLKQLKDNKDPEYVYEIETAAATKEEVQKDLRELKYDLSKLCKSSETGKIVFTITDCGNNKFCISAAYKQQT